MRSESICWVHIGKSFKRLTDGAIKKGRFCASFFDWWSYCLHNGLSITARLPMRPLRTPFFRRLRQKSMKWSQREHITSVHQSNAHGYHNQDVKKYRQKKSTPHFFDADTHLVGMFLRIRCRRYAARMTSAHSTQIRKQDNCSKQIHAMMVYKNVKPPSTNG